MQRKDYDTTKQQIRQTRSEMDQSVTLLVFFLVPISEREIVKS